MIRVQQFLRRVWRHLEGDAAYKNSDMPSFLLLQMEGGPAPDDFVSNGSSFSPDRIFGNDLRPAAHMHDLHYATWVVDEATRKKADYIFYRNLRRCGLGWFLARKYFFRLRVWGACVCDYRGDESARPTGFAWLKLFITRYMEW